MPGGTEHAPARLPAVVLTLQSLRDIGLPVGLADHRRFQVEKRPQGHPVAIPAHVRGLRIDAAVCEFGQPDPVGARVRTRRSQQQQQNMVSHRIPG